MSHYETPKDPAPVYVIVHSWVMGASVLCSLTPALLDMQYATTEVSFRALEIQL